MGHMKFEHTQPYELVLGKNRIDLKTAMSSRFKPIKRLMLESGEQFPYDKLITATGSILINLAGRVRISRRSTTSFQQDLSC
jgi:NAD(P)H-nitrite reductase large subunit